MKNIPILLTVLLCLVSRCAYAQEAGEADEIQYLISSVEALEGAKFFRNGREYDVKAATSHLRLKLRAAGNRVKTADDFIRLCASKSSMSGEPYRIQFSNGITMEAGVFFRNRLKMFRETSMP
jgi:hypothetical protein